MGNSYFCFETMYMHVSQNSHSTHTHLNMSSCFAKYLSKSRAKKSHDLTFLRIWNTSKYMVRNDGNLNSYFKQVKDKTSGGGAAGIVYEKCFVFNCPTCHYNKAMKNSKSSVEIYQAIANEDTNYFSFFCCIQMKWTSSLHWSEWGTVFTF